MDDVQKKDYDPQKDFIIETPQIIEEICFRENNKIQRYEKGKFLGKGGFAKCFEMKSCETKKLYAAKVFEKKALVNPRSRKKLINEIKLHKKLKHENIVKFQHFFEDKENVYILLELCTNQTLNELLKRRKRLTDIEVHYFTIQILNALIYIHKHNIIHRDLKLGNLFVTDKMELKLGDFGLAAKIKFPGEKRRTICGTPNYIAPEILEKKNGHSFEVDIWSFGVIMYTLLYGKPPFETPEIKTTYKKIRMNNFSFPEHFKVNILAQNLITKIFNLDPEKRPSLDMILADEYYQIFDKIPEFIPIASLACPPTEKFISLYRKKEKINFITVSNPHLYSSEKNVINKKGNMSKFNNNINKNQKLIDQIDKENNNLNNKINDNLDSEINYNSEKSKKSSEGEEINLNDKKNNFENLKLNSNNNQQLINKNFLREKELEKNNLNFNLNLIKNKNISENIKEKNGKNIINNNFFINVANLNNMELKIDENFMKKITENCNIIIKEKKNNINNNTIIKTIIDDTNPLGLVYSINDLYLVIYFYDNTNLIKNFKKDSKKSQYFYVDNTSGNNLKFDNSILENYLSKKTGNSEDLLKKFEHLKLYSKKYENEFIKKYIQKNISDEENDKNIVSFFIKKFIKNENVKLFKLSNKIIQIFFKDKSILALSTENNEIYYKNKINEEIFDNIQNIMSSNNEELIQMIKYVKNLLINLVKNEKN